MGNEDSINIRSKDRVKDFGEVFTPTHVVKDMITLISDEAWQDPEYIWLEPTCGNGAFLTEIFQKKKRF